VPQVLFDQTVAEIPVNPEVLKWARKIRGLSQEAAALRLGIPTSELDDYESRRRRPTVGLLKRMSAKYQVNYVGLLMPEPMDDTPVDKLTDFRLSQGHTPRNLSLETHVAISEITGALEAMADLKAESPALFRAQALDTVRPGESAAELAARQREKFGVTLKAQTSWQSDRMARDEWRNEIERHGVFVYAFPLGDECSGLTISHDGLTAICVNDKNTNNGRRIFTMLHEYCHALRRQSGISDENKESPAERYCNRFAAAFLVPASALINLIGEATETREFSVNDVARLAVKMKVSVAAMALRLEHLGYAKPGLYDKVVSIAVPKKEPKTNKKIVIDPVQTQARRLGVRHSRITLDALNKGVINTADARGLLGLEPSRFDDLKAALK
jgi:Zn-dependent peptidase ImmA (M78 family)